MAPNSVPTVIDPELKYHHLSYKQGTPGDDANNGSQGRIDCPKFSLTPSGTAVLDLAALVIGRRWEVSDDPRLRVPRPSCLYCLHLLKLCSLFVSEAALASNV